jgi:RNA polymerase sigma factor (sigma-70 family)
LPIEPRDLLTQNLGLIERAVAFACRRYRFSAEDAEEFGATVQIKLVVNDYEVLRKYEGRSKFSTWISVVVQRLALDYRITKWGKWHASAEAKRLGEVAVELEQLLHRDGRSFDEAATILAFKHPGITRESLRNLSERLPERAPKPRHVDVEDVALVTSPSVVDDAVMAGDRQRLAGALSAAMAGIIRELPEQDRLVLQMRFEGGMSVVQIARALQIEQKLLYRRIEQHIRTMRSALESRGFDANDVVDLIGRDGAILDFDLGNRAARPSKDVDGGERATRTEVSE